LINCFDPIASRLIRAIQNLEHKLQGLFHPVWVTERWRQRIALTLFDWWKRERGSRRQMLMAESRR
jgi:hypothetical protein